MHQSGVDELYHPLREKSMSSQQIFSYQSEEETVMFEDSKETQFYSFPSASPDLITDNAPQDLGDFLKRPTLIKTIAWVPAGVSDADFDPWYLYLNSTEIKKKLDNFAFFRGNMHIKVVVNASPFYYGAMLINYTPLHTHVKSIDNSNVTALIPQSQKPRIWIDLQKNMGGEMILPFVWPYNYIKLTDGTLVQTLGRLRNITYAGLASANGASVTGVTVKIYAWMEDVEMHGNTTTLALQSKKGVVKDEFNNDGPISRPATALANWASYLINVPMIGPYAKATQIGASAVSSVAGLFGWSKVPVIENVKPMKPLFFHDLASAHLSQPTSKMTLDPKAEISVDPRIAFPSTGEDELSISNLVQKDSFLFSTIWATNDAPDTALGGTSVTPYLLNRGSATSTVYTVGYTPMAYVSEAFDDWRGDIIFTIKVICSQYHRGRLRVHWDPVPTSITTDISNRTLTKILDIGEKTELEFRVPYVQYAMWLKNHNFPNNYWNTTGSIASFSPDYDNGFLSIRVLNNLSAPIDTASVTVLMFVRGAENLEFANPRDLPPKTQHFVTQAFIGEAESDTQEKSKPLVDRYLVNWGEAIPSLRLLLQRGCLSQSIPFKAASEDSGAYYQRWLFSQTRFPTGPGYDLDSYNTAKGVVSVVDKPYSYTHQTPLTWFTPMFVTRRGAIQWHYHFNDPTGAISHVSVGRTMLGISSRNVSLGGAALTTVTDTNTSHSVRSRNLMLTNPQTHTGVALTEHKLSPSISIEMPQMVRHRFQFTSPSYSTIGTSVDGSDVDTYQLITYHTTAYATNAKMFLEKYCNAGADFSLNMFLCAPHMYYCTTAGDTPV